MSKNQTTVPADMLRLAMESAHMGTWEWNIRTNEVIWSDNVELIFGLEPGSFGGTFEAYQELIHPEDRDWVVRVILDTVERQDSDDKFQIENRIMRPDGSVFWLGAWGRVYRDESGSPLRILGTTTDVSEKRATEALIREMETRYQQLFNTIPSSVVICEANQPKSNDFTVTHLNDAAQTMWGIAKSSATGKSFSSTFPSLGESELLDSIQRVNVSGSPETQTTHHLRDDKSESWYEHQVYRLPTHEIVVVTTDLTEQKEMEQTRQLLDRQMNQTQRLESLGVLAGGIAHDFNNLLMAILCNVDITKMDLPNDSPISDSIHAIEKASLHAANLCNQMLAYSGKGRFVTKPIDLSALVKEVSHILEISTSKKATLSYHFAEDLQLIHGDPEQLIQIVMNLILNASEAIDSREGTISITTGTEECTTNSLRDVYLNNDLSEGTYVFLEVSDNGCGMDEKTVARLFDPFFTTKFEGRGLGMASVMGIVCGHRGTIKVASEIGKGTTFRILFPVLDDELIEEDPELAQKDDRFSGTALLVDDEESVRLATGRMLRKIGFHVIEACNGRHAIDQYQIHRNEISFILLDLTMPHMDGGEALRELEKIGSTTPVILMSGFDKQEVGSRIRNECISGFLHKPYRYDDLIQAIQSALEEPASSAPV